MVYLLLFYEFFKIGLFAIGGGLVTLPFLTSIAQRYDWLSIDIIPDMIAISESTPGPIGINMATYAGYNAAGVLGGIVATLSEILPALIIVMIVARFLTKFNENKYVKSVFGGLRPAVVGMIAAAGWSLARMTFINETVAASISEAFASMSTLVKYIDYKSIILFIVVFYLIKKFDKHPIWYIAGAGVMGIIFQMAHIA